MTGLIEDLYRNVFLIAKSLKNALCSIDKSIREVTCKSLVWRSPRSENYKLLLLDVNVYVFERWTSCYECNPQISIRFFCLRHQISTQYCSVSTRPVLGKYSVLGQYSVSTRPVLSQYSASTRPVLSTLSVLDQY